MPQSVLTKKFFIGCEVTAEIRAHLYQSRTWQHANIQPIKNFIQVHHSGKDYVGCYLDQEQGSVAELTERAEYILHDLHKFCPTIELSKLQPVIFSQQFIA